MNGFHESEEAEWTVSLFQEEKRIWPKIIGGKKRLFSKRYCSGAGRGVKQRHHGLKVKQVDIPWDPISAHQHQLCFT